MISKKLHVVDPDPRRRAQVALDLAEDFFPQIYENLEELMAFSPREGIVFVNDDLSNDPLAELHAHFSNSGNTLPVALYSRAPDMPRVVEAIFSGAVDYLAWPLDKDVIRTSFDRIAGRLGSLNGAMQKRSAASKKVAGLSSRERDTLLHLINGNSNKEIAKIMEISPRTVEIHRANVLKKLGAGSTADAVRIGLYAGLEDEVDREQ